MIGATERLADLIETPGAPFDLEAEFNHLLVLLFNRVLTGGNLDAVGMVEGLAHLPPKPRAMDFLALPRWLTGSKSLVKCGATSPNTTAYSTGRSMRDVTTATPAAGTRCGAWRTRATGTRLISCQGMRSATRP